MKTLIQDRPVAFRAIELPEAIVVAPLMDEFEEFIVNEAEIQCHTPVNDKGEREVNIFLTGRQIKSIAFVLSELGFRTSSGSYFSNPSNSVTPSEKKDDE